MRQCMTAWVNIIIFTHIRPITVHCTSPGLAPGLGVFVLVWRGATLRIERYATVMRHNYILRWAFGHCSRIVNFRTENITTSTPRLFRSTPSAYYAPKTYQRQLADMCHLHRMSLNIYDDVTEWLRYRRLPIVLCFVTTLYEIILLCRFSRA